MMLAASSFWMPCHDGAPSFRSCNQRRQLGEYDFQFYRSCSKHRFQGMSSKPVMFRAQELQLVIDVSHTHSAPICCLGWFWSGSHSK